jgi:hypothetical protein
MNWKTKERRVIEEEKKTIPQRYVYITHTGGGRTQKYKENINRARKSTGVRIYAHRLRTLQQYAPPPNLHLIVQRR